MKNSVFLYSLLKMFVPLVNDVLIIPVYPGNRKDIYNAIQGNPFDLVRDYDKYFENRDISVFDFSYSIGKLDIYLNCSTGTPFKGQYTYKAVFTKQETPVSYPMKHYAIFHAPDYDTAYAMTKEPGFTKQEQEKQGCYSLVYNYFELL